MPSPPVSPLLKTKWFHGECELSPSITYLHEGMAPNFKAIWISKWAISASPLVCRPGENHWTWRWVAERVAERLGTTVFKRQEERWKASETGEFSGAFPWEGTNDGDLGYKITDYPSASGKTRRSLSLWWRQDSLQAMLWLTITWASYESKASLSSENEKALMEPFKRKKPFGWSWSPLPFLSVRPEATP